MAVTFVHGLYHPTALCLVDRNGVMRAQYAHKGHLRNVITADLDADGKDELVAAGVNNAPAYNGPTLVLLDEDHEPATALTLQKLRERVKNACVT